jgi:hypothetical protein
MFLPKMFGLVGGVLLSELVAADIFSAYVGVCVCVSTSTAVWGVRAAGGVRAYRPMISPEHASEIQTK